MAKITLHTPMYLLDKETTTEYEANDIIHVKSVAGDDDRDGTYFYIKGISERQYCIETANQLKKLIQNNETEQIPLLIFQAGSGNAMAVGNSNNVSSSGKEGGWAISGWWITLIGTLVGVISLTLYMLGK